MGCNSPSIAGGGLRRRRLTCPTHKNEQARQSHQPVPIRWQWEEQMGCKLPAMPAALLAGTLCTGAPAAAQKQGGTLKYYHRDNPPTASIHEEATISTVNPFMAVFNNLVLFDQTKPINSLDTIVPDLAESWSRSPDNKRLTIKL